MQIVKKSNFAIGLSLFIAMAVIFQFLVFFPSLKYASIARNNADVLITEETARSIMKGSSIFDFRLTQAPYLFPDLVFAIIFAVLPTPVGTTALLWAISFAFGSIVIWDRVIRLCTSITQEFRILVDSFIALMFLISVIVPNFGNEYANYITFIGHHGSVALAVPIFMLVADSRLSLTNHGMVSPLGLFLLLLFTISDSLVAIAILSPVGILMLLDIKRKDTRGNALLSVALLICVVALARSFSYINPFPQDREFFTYFFSSFPTLASHSARLFLHDMARMLKEPSSLPMMVVAILSLAYNCIAWLRDRKSGSDKIRRMMGVIVLGFALILVCQIGLGLYMSIDSARQWVWIPFVSIILSVIDIVQRIPLRVFVVVVILTAATSSLLMIKIGVKNKGESRDEQYVELAESLRKIMPEGSVMLADYWDSRPVRMYSQDAIYAIPFYNGSVFTNSSNIKEIRMKLPGFALLKNEKGRADHNLSSVYDVEFYAKDFGSPSKRYDITTRNGKSYILLDYSTNANFLECMRYICERAY